MKPLQLVVVTATTNLDRAEDCLASWGDVRVVVLHNGHVGRDARGVVATSHDLRWECLVPATDDAPYLGSVEAFRRGVDYALTYHPDADLIACLHDDLAIHDPDWVGRVCRYFAENPAMGLAGFGGAIALGDPDLYQKDYDPFSLARRGFRSNLTDAEAHGLRRLYPERVACLDGFSQIGRREFWEGRYGPHTRTFLPDGRDPRPRPWTVLADLGMVHHFYDGALGCLAARYGWETWYLPIACTHFGGRTAVGDAGYQAWANAQPQGGDHGFWREAHKIGYAAFRDVLPLRV